MNSKMGSLVAKLKSSEEAKTKKIKTAKIKQEMWSKKDPSYSLIFESFDKIKGEVDEKN